MVNGQWSMVNGQEALLMKRRRGLGLILYFLTAKGKCSVGSVQFSEL